MSLKIKPSFIYFSQVFAGIGIGVLMGLIIGLSVSPVVKSILGTLAGLLGVFLGLQENIFGKSKQPPDSTSPIILSSLRAGSFGLACAITILFGLYIRTHDAIGLTPKDQVKKWIDAGYKKPLARELALVEKMGMTSMQLLNLHKQKKKIVKESAGDSSGVTTKKKAEVVEEEIENTVSMKPGFASSVLFSKEDMLGLSSILDPVDYDNNTEKALKQYKSFEIPQLDRYSDALAGYGLEPAKQIALLTQVSDLAVALYSFEPQYDKIQKAMRSIKNTEKLVSENNFPQLQKLLTTVKENIPAKEQDNFMTILSDLLFETKV